MDPTAAYADMQDAYVRGDYSAALDHAGDILGWLDRGGFPPDGLSADHARLQAASCARVCRAVLSNPAYSKV